MRTRRPYGARKERSNARRRRQRLQQVGEAAVVRRLRGAVLELAQHAVDDLRLAGVAAGALAASAQRREQVDDRDALGRTPELEALDARVARLGQQDAGRAQLVRDLAHRA